MKMEPRGFWPGKCLCCFWSTHMMEWRGNSYNLPCWLQHWALSPHLLWSFLLQGVEAQAWAIFCCNPDMMMLSFCQSWLYFGCFKPYSLGYELTIVHFFSNFGEQMVCFHKISLKCNPDKEVNLKVAVKYLPPFLIENWHFEMLKLYYFLYPCNRSGAKAWWTR